MGRKEVGKGKKKGKRERKDGKMGRKGEDKGRKEGKRRRKREKEEEIVR